MTFPSIRRTCVAVAAACGALAALPATAADSVRAYAGVVAGNAQVGSPLPFSCSTGGPVILNGWFAGLRVPAEGIGPCGLVGGADDRTGAAGPLTATFTATGPMANPGSSFTGTAAARADYWSLGVATSGVANGQSSTFTYAQAATFASFTNDVTLERPGIATGTPGTVDFSFLIDTVANSLAVAPFSQQVDLRLGLRVNGTFIWDLFRATLRENQLPVISGGATGLPGAFVLGPGSLAGSALATSTAHFGIQWGVPFNLEVAFISDAWPCCNGASVMLDSLNSARLAGISATADGVSIGDFSVLTNAGPPVGPAGIVPEPAGALLLPAGLGVVFLLAQRRRRERRTN